MTAALLSAGLLEQLRGRWRQREVEILDHLQPGLSDAAMTELVAPLGLSLPPEARRWWGWHNGVSAVLNAGSPQADIGVGLLFFPLSAAVDLYQTRRPEFVELFAGLHREFPDRVPPPDAYWPPHWLPFTRHGHGAALALDCSATGDQPSPVYELDWEDAQPYQRPLTSSLGELVEKAIDAIDRGAWFYDPARRRWLIDPAKEDTSDRSAHPFG